MIYDRILRTYTDPGGTPLHRMLTYAATYYYGPKEVYYGRYWDSVAAGSRIDLLCELPRADEITAAMYAVPEDGHVYRIEQAQHGLDGDGLPITTLSLRRMEEYFDIGIPDPTPPEGGNDT